MLSCQWSISRIKECHGYSSTEQGQREITHNIKAIELLITTRILQPFILTEELIAKYLDKVLSTNFLINSQQ